MNREPSNLEEFCGTQIFHRSLKHQGPRRSLAKPLRRATTKPSEVPRMYRSALILGFYLSFAVALGAACSNGQADTPGDDAFTPSGGTTNSGGSGGTGTSGGSGGTLATGG